MSQNFPPDHGSGGTPNPYGDKGPLNPYGTPAPVQQKSQWGTGRIVLVVLAVIGGLGLVSCCGCGGFLYFTMNFAMGEVGKEITKQYVNEPEVLKELGGIDSVSINWMKSFEENSKSPDNDSNELVFDVSGPQGKGIFIIDTADGPDNEIRAVRLRTDKGEWELPPWKQPGSELPPVTDSEVEPVMEESETAK